MQTYFEHMIQAAYEQRASDIYLLPEQGRYRIKFHNGSQPIGYRIISSQLADQLFSFLKFKAQMNIAENRRPQVGSMIMAFGQENLSLRVSTVGNFANKETMVIRILYDQSFHELSWLIDQQFDQLEKAIPQQGLVVVAGPTGSGKTSTIHQLLNKQSDRKMILTIEDPVEIRDEKIVQLQVNNEANMSYLDLIKVALRHHPDILLIGEIRDAQTAQAAVQASLSGHLVFSTLHANSSLGVISRLLEMNVDPVLLKDVMRLAVYQRLLPTQSGDQAALADWQLFTDGWDQPMAAFTPKWKENLDDAYRHSWISKEIYEAYLKIAS
ncbi:MAG: competence type IV pilus ATPase ComGA [Oenococcus sp.]|uniref:competence type IV pilus ATPase ComGA n=1 Tax=Oenococcus sp. TaxID=1979414 RepID=UPI0039E7463A